MDVTYVVHILRTYKDNILLVFHIVLHADLSFIGIIKLSQSVILIKLHNWYVCGISQVMNTLRPYFG